MAITKYEVSEKTDFRKFKKFRKFQAKISEKFGG